MHSRTKDHFDVRRQMTITSFTDRSMTVSDWNVRFIQKIGNSKKGELHVDKHAFFKN